MELLGKASDGPGIDPGELTALISDPIGRELERGPQIPLALFDELDPDFRYRTDIENLTVDEIRRGQRYESASETITLLDVACELTADVKFQDRRTEDTDLWMSVNEPFRVVGDLQLLLPDSESDQQPELVTARLRSTTSIHAHIGEDGQRSWTILTALDD